MISVPAGVRVLVATKPVDFRRGADSRRRWRRTSFNAIRFPGRSLSSVRNGRNRSKILAGSAATTRKARSERPTTPFAPLKSARRREAQQNQRSGQLMCCQNRTNQLLIDTPLCSPRAEGSAAGGPRIIAIAKCRNWLTYAATSRSADCTPRRSACLASTQSVFADRSASRISARSAPLRAPARGGHFGQIHPIVRTIV